MCVCVCALVANKAILPAIIKVLYLFFKLNCNLKLSTGFFLAEVNISVSTKQPTLPQLRLSQQQPRELSVNNNLSQNISSHVPESNISSRLSPVTHQQQQPASNYPMTKKARLLAAVAASSSPSPPSPNDVTGRLSPPVTSCSPSLPPAHLSTCPSSLLDQQAIDDVMARIVDKMRALEERHLTGERFGIVLTTKGKTLFRVIITRKVLLYNKRRPPFTLLTEY